MAEIATQFFIMGIVAGVIGVIFHLNDMKVNDIAVSFKDGAKDLIGAALVVAMAQGIMQVLGGSDPTTPTVINTIMYGISQALAGLSGAAAAVLMYVFQSVFNFFVVSGSGQAAITMPIMAPLADLLGVSRQTSVLAFQLGDAFTNLIVPDLRLSDRSPGDLQKNRVVELDQIHVEILRDTDDWSSHYDSDCGCHWILRGVRENDIISEHRRLCAGIPRKKRRSYCV